MMRVLTVSDDGVKTVDIDEGAMQVAVARLPAFSPRQQAVLAGIVEGKRNVDIAAALGLSEKTVKAHVSAVIRILGAKNRTDAAVKAVTGAA